MSTNRARSFGLAIIVAIGVIAAMAAMGLFSTGRTALAAEPTGVVFTPTSLDVNAPAAWKVTFNRPDDSTLADLTWGSSTISVTFPAGVVVPATIDKSRVTVGTTVLHRPTTDPTVTGNTVMVELPFVDATSAAIVDADPEQLIDSDEPVTVKFSQPAGILNPSARGAAGTGGEASAGSAATSDDVPAGPAPIALVFNETITLDKSSSPEGGPVEVTLGGFTPGLQVTLSGAVSGSGTVKSDGTAVISGTMGSDSGTVTATDGAGLPATTTDDIMVTATLTATATGKAQDQVTLTGKNFTLLANIPLTGIEFGGEALHANNVKTAESAAGEGIPLSHEDQDGYLDDFSIDILIPSNAASGVNQIKVTDSGSEGASATATVTVAARTVTLSPSSGPPGTAVTVSVTGFPGSKSAADDNTITISPDATPDDETTADVEKATVDDLITTSSGGLSGTNIVTIPSEADEGTIEVTVSIRGVDFAAETEDAAAKGDTTGSATFTVVKRGLTVSPASGPKGTSILLSGGNYTPRGTIKADSILVETTEGNHGEVTLDSSGSIPSTSVIVPPDVSYGAVDVTVTVEDDDDKTVTGVGTFTVTQPTISLAPASVAMGNDVTITGEGWVGNSIVTIVMSRLTDDRALTTDVVTTDGLGGFTTSMTVPNNVGVGPDMVSVGAHDGALGNETLAVNLSVPAATITLSPTGTATVGDRVTVTATGFTPSTGLSEFTIGGANIMEGVVVTDEQGNLTTSFTVPGLTGAQLVKVKIGNDDVSTSIVVEKGTASAVTDPRALFASEIASDNLVRIFYFDNGTKQFSFFDPAFDDDANTLNSIVKGQIVDIGVNANTTFRGVDLTPVYNRIALP